MFGDAETHWPPLTPTTVAVHDDANGPSHLTKKQKQRVKEQQRLKLKKAQEAAGPARKSWYDISEEPSRDYDDEDDDVQSSVSSSASGGEGADATANGTSSAAAAAPAGPQEMMRSELMKTYGYPPEEIDAAMERMFELGLPYDDAEEVDAFLRLEKAKELSTASASAGREAVSAGTESQSRDKESQTPTLPSTPPDDNGSRLEEAVDETQEEEEVEEPATAGADDVGDDAATADDDEISDRGTVQATAPAAAAKARQASTEPKNVSTASNAAGGNGSSGDVVVGVLARLDMVSKANNLDDAIFALTEWVDKVATPTEIVELCDTRKCQAFLTILRRTIQQPRSSYDKRVLALISEVLRGVARDQDRPTGTVTTAIGNSIKSARAVVKSSKTYGSAMEACADTVSKRVASELHRAVLKLRRDNLALSAANPAGKADTIRALEAEIEAMASSLATTDGGLLGLMTKRDCHRSAADMSSTIVGLSISPSVPSEEGIDMSGESSDSDNSGDDSTAAASMTNPQNVMTSLLGKDYDAIISAKSEYDQLRSELDAARSSMASNRTELIKERDGYKAEREVVNSQIDDLRKQLEELEKKGNKLDASANAVESRLEDLDAELDDEVKTIKVGLSVRSAAHQVEEAARGVADELDSLRNALDDTTAPVTPRGRNRSPSPPSYSPEKVSTKMGIYFVRIRNYFKAEADCIEFIANRANGLEKGLADLEREIDECAMLGMTTNVMLMTNSLRETQQNITEDRGVVVMLTSEAEKVQVDFMKRLGEYKSATSCPTMTPSQALSSLQVSVLSDIRDAMKRIGLKDKGLSDYITGVASTPNTPSTTKSIKSVTKAYDNDTNKAEPPTNKDKTDSEALPSEEDILEAADEFFEAADKDTVTVIDICISIENKFGVNLDKSTRNSIKDRFLKLLDEAESDEPAPEKDQTTDQAVENCDAVSTLTPVSQSTLHSHSSVVRPVLPPPPPPPVSASKMPRLSWAKSPTTPGGRPPRSKSLLEIQQEEMSAKKASQNR